MIRNAQIEPARFAFHLDAHSGVPVYRQLIDQVQGAVASGSLSAGDQLPTVRHVAIELAINPNTEIRGMLDTQQGTGTFVAEQKVELSKEVRDRQLGQLVNEFVSRAGSTGITVNELIDALREFSQRGPRR